MDHAVGGVRSVKRGGRTTDYLDLFNVSIGHRDQLQRRQSDRWRAGNSIVDQGQQRAGQVVVEPPNHDPGRGKTGGHNVDGRNGREMRGGRQGSARAEFLGFEDADGRRCIQELFGLPRSRYGNGVDELITRYEANLE